MAGSAGGFAAAALVELNSRPGVPVGSEAGAGDVAAVVLVVAARLGADSAALLAN